MGLNMAKEEAYVLYQQLCDEVFGARALQIKQVPSNNVIGTLRHLDDYDVFKKNFKNRLIRLRKRFEGTAAYPALLEQVKQVADPKNWEGAYAELVAYDVMWNDHVMTPMELDKTMDAAESYAGEMGYKATNEDGYLPDYGIFFDVKILADTVGVILLLIQVRLYDVTYCQNIPWMMTMRIMAALTGRICMMSWWPS